MVITTVFVVVKGSWPFNSLDDISSYELRLRCSSARWICMDEGYITMALDLYYPLMKKIIPFHP
jgi:hypothetical protein